MTKKTKVKWSEIKNFSPKDFGEPDKMNVGLVYKLQEFRTHLNTPIYITSAYSVDGHATKSMHYVGKAIDILVPGMVLLDLYMEAERWDWNGLGIYPHWHYKGAKVGGMHLDVRDGGRAARWWFDVQTNKYRPWDAINLRRLVMSKRL